MSFLTLETAEIERLVPDVCIIGSGPAGITLACELDGTNLSVLLLEAGDLKLNPSLEEDYKGSADAPHAGASQFRRFGFGGTSSIWGGRCVPFDPVDFERRDYVSNSGWPISYDEVARFYPKAMNYCDAGEFEFSIRAMKAPKKNFLENSNDTLLADRIERYSLPTNFGKRYQEKLKNSKNVSIVLGTRCVALEKKQGDDLIETAECVDMDGKSFHLRATIFVLSVGGIETPRLLFASDKMGSGLGNREDLVGRFYACHFESLCGKLVANRVPVAFDFEKTREGVYCRRKIQFTSESQKSHRILNSAFRLHFPDYSDASHGSSVMSAIYLAKSTLIPEYQAILNNDAQAAAASTNADHLLNVAKGIPSLMRFGVQWLVQRQLATRKLPYTLIPNADGSFPLEFNSEQTPLASSRVLPTGEKDRHGIRRVNIQWKLCEEDINSAFRSFLLLRNVIERDTPCRLEINEEELDRRIRRSIPVGGHHMGTARMAASPKQGVVNTDSAVFGIPNLYINSSAVFPTNSHANPTLTIVAMAIRLAEHLRVSLQKTVV